MSRHLVKKHKDEKRVKDAIKLNRKSRNLEFQKIRREGILFHNKAEARKENPNYQGERKRKKYFNLLLCSACSGFFSKRFFSRHKKRCKRINDTPAIGVPLHLHSISEGQRISKEFVQKVLLNMRKDDVGNLVQNDENILYLGSRFFKKVEHKKEKAQSIHNKVRSEMRQLATLYQAFQDLEGIHKPNGNSMDMFIRENYDNLCHAIDTITTKEDKTMKAGSRQLLYFLLLKSLKKLRDKMFIEKKDDMWNDLNQYYNFFKSNEDAIILSARYQLENNRLKKARRPSQLPLEEDISAIHSYIQKRMKELCDKFSFWSAPTFIELRNITMSRLTLWNGRRGGETGRLSISEWKEGFADGWIDKQRLKSLSEADQQLVQSTKIVYQAGKGNRHLVSLLIPEDTVQAMNKLSDDRSRELAGVSSENTFVFASTQNSNLNFSGWHALQEVCSSLNLKSPKLINATNNRHRISTLYASMDLPEKERDLFFTHMGHSSEMNKNVYQAPLALLGITKVGRQLEKLGNGK